MRIIEPKELGRSQSKSRKKSRRRLRYLLLVLFIVLGIGISIQAYSRPLPVLIPTVTALNIPSHKVSLIWPAEGQAAIGAVGYGLLASSGAESPVPMASIAKVMTALAVLQQHPLTLGQEGPMLTLTADDVAIYNNYASQDGSVVSVTDGEQISEYQALEAMLLPSANNIADSLATWAFGSMDNYLSFANNLAITLELHQTHLADASGFSPQTVSSADDLVLLGQRALREPVLAKIVGLKQADIPVAGTVDNVNYLLGQHEIIGIKTGNTNEAGGCFLFAAKHDYGGGNIVTVVGAVMGNSNLGTAMSSSLPLLDSALQNFGTITIAKSGQQLGQYTLPWGGSIAVVTQSKFSVFGWLGANLKSTTYLDGVFAPLPPGTKIGSVQVAGSNIHQTMSVITAKSMPLPGWRWRLFR